MSDLNRFFPSARFSKPSLIDGIHVPRRRPRIRGQLVAGLLGALLASASTPIRGQPEITLEAKVKAAIVVKLAKFVEWPQAVVAASAPLRICLIGETPLAAALADAHGKSVHGHELKIQTLSSGSDRQLESCQILFLGLSETAQAETTLNKIMTRPILTVSDIPRFAQKGGMIELVREDDHLGFNINIGIARKTGIALNSQLLALAKVIE